MECYIHQNLFVFRFIGSVHSLPVSAYLPHGYLGLTPSSPQAGRSGVRLPYYYVAVIKYEMSV